MPDNVEVGLSKKNGGSEEPVKISSRVMFDNASEPAMMLSVPEYGAGLHSPCSKTARHVQHQ